MQQHYSKPRGREYSLSLYLQALCENWTRSCCCSGPPLQPCPVFRSAYQGQNVHPGSAAGHPGDSYRAPGAAVFWNPPPQGAPAPPALSHIRKPRGHPFGRRPSQKIVTKGWLPCRLHSGKSDAHFWSSVRILKVCFVKAVSMAEQGIAWIFCSWAHIQLNASIIRSKYLSLYSFM